MSENMGFKGWKAQYALAAARAPMVRREIEVQSDFSSNSALAKEMEPLMRSNIPAEIGKREARRCEGVS